MRLTIKNKKMTAEQIKEINFGIEVAKSLSEGKYRRIDAASDFIAAKINERPCVVYAGKEPEILQTYEKGVLIGNRVCRIIKILY